MVGLDAGSVPELIKAVTEAYDGITVEALTAAVREFFETANPGAAAPDR